MEAERRILNPREELFNVISHGAGALLSAASLVILVITALRKGDAWHVVSFSLFGASLLLLYSASTLYHRFPAGKAGNLLARLDHSAIFILIAGTYTPILLTAMRGLTGWILFGVIWGLALTGIVIRSIYLFKFRRLMVGLYLAMGWLFVLVIRDVINTLPRASLRFLLAGGLLYSIGVVFYAWRKLPYGHGIWHLFVLGGSILHFFAILTILP